MPGRSSDRPSAVRQVDGIVEPDFGVACEFAPLFHSVVKAIGSSGTLLNERTAHNGAGIDHWIMRTPFDIESKFVESFATRLGADKLMHGIFAMFF